MNSTTGEFPNKPAVMFGQVRLPSGDTDSKVERLVGEISSFEMKEEKTRRELLEKYEALPVMEYQRIEQIAQLLRSVIDYIVYRAVQKRNEEMVYEWRLSNSLPRMDEESNTWQPYALGDESKPAVFQNSPIYPAIAYMNSHAKEKLNMHSMAELCHLSPSYFSRLFLRETGENFNDYTARTKITLAKRELRDTDKSISQIALDLGYMDSSYFIRVFRKLEGITPSRYRNYRYV